MSDVIYLNKLAIRVAIEATYGNIVVPGANDAIEVSNVQLTPLDGTEAERKIARPFFGASSKTQVTQSRKLTFEVGFAGVKNVGDLPGYATLMRACATRIVNTPAPDPDAGTLIQPITDDIESVTIFTVIDRQLYKMVGTRGTVKATVNNGGIPVYQFEFVSSYEPIEELPAMPQVSYASFEKTLPVNKANTTLLVNGIAVIGTAFELDFGNDVSHENAMNYESTDIGDRNSTGSVTFFNTPIAVANWVDLAAQSAIVPIILRHGQAATNTVGVTIPRAELGKPSFGEQKGKQTITIPYQALPSDLGNDEWEIAV